MDKREMWNSGLEYLRSSRNAWWNKDYIKFLVENVWKIDEPVDVVDFGCGIGFVGELLLPILPIGSTYTGIDIGDKLIEEAERVFAKTNYSTRFYTSDIYDYQPDRKYDIAISHTLFQHIESPLPILVKMSEAVVDGGLVVVMDVSRNAASAMLHIEGFNYSCPGILGIEQKVRSGIFQQSGKDFEIGLKLPIMMKQLNLKDVDIRVNDFVQFISPDHDDYHEKYQAFAAAWKYHEVSNDRESSFIERYTRYGLSEKEALSLLGAQQEISQYIEDNSEGISAVCGHSLLVSYGIKK